MRSRPTNVDRKKTFKHPNSVLKTEIQHKSHIAKQKIGLAIPKKRKKETVRRLESELSGSVVVFQNEKLLGKQAGRTGRDGTGQ